MAESSGITPLLVELRGDSTHFDRFLNIALNRLTGTASRMESVGIQMSLAVTGPLAAIGTVSTVAFNNFDLAMTKSTAIMSNVTADMRREMEDLAITMSANTATSATDLAESYFFLASAGMNAEQSMKSLGIVQKFASAGAFDMATATDLLTDAQSALGLVTKDVTKNQENLAQVSDVLIKANTLANATAEQFATSLTTKSAAALRLVNKDMEEGVAVLAAYADQGTKGAAAGERLAIMLRELQNASLKNSRAWDKLNLSVFDAEGAMLPIVDILRQLEGVLEGASDQQKKLTLSTLGFTEESMNAITALLGVTDKIEEYEKKLRSAQGVTEEVAGEQMKAISKQWQQFRNQLTAIGIGIGRTLSPALRGLNGILQSLTQWWLGLNESTRKAIVIMGSVTAAVGPLLLVLSNLKLITMAVNFAFTALAANPMTLVALGLAGLVIGLAEVYDSFDRTRVAAKKYGAELNALQTKQDDIILSVTDKETSQFGKLSQLTHKSKEETKELVGLVSRLRKEYGSILGGVDADTGLPKDMKRFQDNLGLASTFTSDNSYKQEFAVLESRMLQLSQMKLEAEKASNYEWVNQEKNAAELLRIQERMQETEDKILRLKFKQGEEQRAMLGIQKQMVEEAKRGSIQGLLGAAKKGLGKFGIDVPDEAHELRILKRGLMGGAQNSIEALLGTLRKGGGALLPKLIQNDFKAEKSGPLQFTRAGTRASAEGRFRRSQARKNDMALKKHLELMKAIKEGIEKITGLPAANIMGGS